MAILITGGARSGKSAFAERLARSISKEGIYIATGRAFDDEMKERIRQHRQDRDAQSGMAWTTIEEPFALAERLRAYALPQGAEGGSLVLIDCLTLWLTNHLLRGEEDPAADVQAEMNKLIEAVADFPLPLLIVTNEVGDGIVPSYPLGRRFRDEAGRLNQRIAAVCDRVFLVTSGIPIDLRSIEFRVEGNV